jgi:hypothetical protein
MQFMITIGVICFDREDFKNYMKFYLKDCKIIRETNESRIIEGITYKAIYDPDHSFHSMTFNYYIFASKAPKNEKIVDIIENAILYSYYKPHTNI